MQLQLKCNICGSVWPNFVKLATHVSSKHNISSKEYYDKYIKKPDEGVCLTCGKPTRYKSMRIGYVKYCSGPCVSNDPNIKKRKEETYLKHYGVNNPSFSPEIIKKIGDSIEKRFGVRNAMQCEEIKEKSRNTCLEKYGVPTALQAKEIRDKIKETCYMKYNGPAPACSEKTREKQRNTCLDKYGVEYYSSTDECKDKIKNTCLEKYGVENPFQSEEKKEKIKQTCIQKYGVDHASQAVEVKEKVKQTCLERYGVPSYPNTPDFREKSKRTCLRKYGVEYVSQCHEILCKARKKFYRDGVKFDSKFEMDFYDFLTINHINFIFQPEEHFTYIVDEKERHYFPDFLILENDKRIFVELKGLHFFENMDPNGKLVNPFDRSEKADAANAAKQKCMKDNNVYIITSRKNFNDVLKLI